jgi:hypothetical protein
LQDVLLSFEILGFAAFLNRAARNLNSIMGLGEVAGILVAFLVL